MLEGERKIREFSVTASSVVYYGIDERARVPVLRSFGFCVEQCASLPQLEGLLQSPRVDAVLFPEPPSLQVIDAVQHVSSVPLVTFTSDFSLEGDHRLDLVIPPMTRPDDWLSSIEQFLQRSRVLRGESNILRARSAALRAESAAIRVQTQKAFEVFVKKRFEEK
jgi:hypothetical protein